MDLPVTQVTSVTQRSPRGAQAAQWAVQALLTDDGTRRRKLLAAALASDPTLQSSLLNLISDCACTDEAWREDLRIAAFGDAAVPSDIPDWPTTLRTLIAKLARLEVLERDFTPAVEREKQVAIHSLAYGASHEINNPLANISSRAQTLLRDETDPERRRKLETINSQAFRAHEMIADLMLFAKPPSLHLQAIDAASLVQQVERELRPAFVEQNTEFRVELETGAFPIRGDREHLLVAIISLCRNSLEALASGGQITLQLTRRTNSQGAVDACLTVHDNGPGIPAEILPRIFDPFFSGREAGRGLGLGLSKCWRIVTLHSGTIDVESRVGQGAKFTIQLPCIAASEWSGG